MNYVEFPHLRPFYPYALLLLPRPHPRIPILVQTERRQTLVDFSQEDCPKTATRPPGIAGSAAQVHEARGRQSWQSLHSHGHAVDTVTLLGTPISFPRLIRPTPKNTRPPPHPHSFPGTQIPEYADSAHATYGQYAVAPFCYQACHDTGHNDNGDRVRSNLLDVPWQVRTHWPATDGRTPSTPRTSVAPSLGSI